jgi:hypothetical protein
VAVVLLISALVFSGCSLPGSSDSKTATSASSTVPTTNGQTGTPAIVNGTPQVVNPIILAPPILVVQAASGTQDGNFGSYYWMIDSGLADKAAARGIEIQKDPLKVKQGETIQLSWKQQNSKSDSTLTDLTISAYPEDKSIVTVTTGQGTLTGFKASGTPMTTDKLPPTSTSWA